MTAPTPDAQTAQRPGEEETWRTASFQLHSIWLALSVTALLLSCMLTIRSQTEVIVPLINRPLPELCTFKRATGAECPGCGLTRSFISLGHGDAWAAWHYNPSGVMLFAAALFQVPYRSAQLWRLMSGKAEIRCPSLNWAAVLLLAAMCAQWAYRMGELLLYRFG